MHYKVSVIIPVYNVEQYLEQCLDSIVNQTLKEVEIIIVDDGSKDRSREIVDEYEEKYADVFSIHKEHKGPGAARNSGMSCAHGDYLYFMDSDDCLDINALERLYQVASQEGLDLVLFSGKAFTEDKDLKDIVSRFRYLRTRHLNKVMSGKDGFLLTHSDGEYMTSLCIRFYDRSYLKKINIEFNEDIIHEDEDFIVSDLHFQNLWQEGWCPSCLLSPKTVEICFVAVERECSGIRQIFLPYMFQDILFFYLPDFRAASPIPNRPIVMVRKISLHIHHAFAPLYVFCQCSTTPSWHTGNLWRFGRWQTPRPFCYIAADAIKPASYIICISPAYPQHLPRKLAVLLLQGKRLLQQGNLFPAQPRGGHAGCLYGIVRNFA